MSMIGKLFGVSLAGVMALGIVGGVSPTSASTIRVDGNALPGIIFGTGVDNGGFVGKRNNGRSTEIGLRARLRYDENGDGTNDFGGLGADSGEATFYNVRDNTPDGRAVFSIDWAINVNYDGDSDLSLDDYRIVLEYDSNPNSGRTWNSIGLDLAALMDPGAIADDFLDVDKAGLLYGSYFGDNNTALSANNQSGGGTNPMQEVAAIQADQGGTQEEAFGAWVAGGGLQTIGNMNVMQGTANIGFDPFAAAYGDVTANGDYRFRLSLYEGETRIHRSSIRVYVEDEPSGPEFGGGGDLTPVPVPAALPLLALGVGGLAVMRKRRKKEE